MHTTHMEVQMKVQIDTIPIWEALEQDSIAIKPVSAR